MTDRITDFDFYQDAAEKTAVYSNIFTEEQVFGIVGLMTAAIPELHDVVIPDVVVPAMEEGMREAGNVKIAYAALGLAGEAGEVAEKVKKLIRDADQHRNVDGTLTDEFKDALRKELGDVLWYLAAVATEAGLSLSEVAEANIAKLRSRKERGQLQGSGDDR